MDAGLGAGGLAAVWRKYGRGCGLGKPYRRRAKQKKLILEAVEGQREAISSSIKVEEVYFGTEEGFISKMWKGRRGRYGSVEEVSSLVGTCGGRKRRQRRLIPALPRPSYVIRYFSILGLEGGSIWLSLVRQYLLNKFSVREVSILLESYNR